MDVRKTYKLYVNGAFVRSESQRTYEAAAMNVPRSTRKDVRDAVKAARGAFAGWSGRTAMNRGQVLYRAAEMLDARAPEMTRLEGVERGEVAESVEALLWYAGLTDKLAQLWGTVNPVAGPYFTFSLPEPTGVVGIVAPERPSLLGLVAPLAAALCGGSTAVVLASPALPLPALVFGEVLATSDLPAGAANLLTGHHRETLPTLAAHRDVNAIEVSGCDEEERTQVETAAADSVTRVVAIEPDQRLSPHAALAFMEVKTVWHPVGR